MLVLHGYVSVLGLDCNPAPVALDEYEFEPIVINALASRNSKPNAEQVCHA